MAAALTTGCFPVRYVAQATAGQVDLLSRRVPIERLLRDGSAPPKLKEILADVERIKSFGQTLGLAATDNYREYVELDRDAAVWVVTACKPLAFEPLTFSFPIAGSFPYLGWFDRQSAEAHAAELREQGWDVYLRGASAFSTLGWFSDPILSTMIRHSRTPTLGIVNVVLHESVHATVHIDNQSSFNETLASFIADGATCDYVLERHGAASPMLKACHRRRERVARAQGLIDAAYKDLEGTYASSTFTDDEKRARKREVVSALAEALGSREPINNATLLADQTYQTDTTAMQQLFDQCGRSWPRFIDAVLQLTADSFAVEQQRDLAPVLAPLSTTSACRGQ